MVNFIYLLICIFVYKIIIFKSFGKHLIKIRIFATWLRMLINFHPLWYLMSMHKKINCICVYVFCLFYCVFVHVYKLENALDCIMVVRGFVLLKMDESFMFKFCMKYVFEIIVSNFDIYTMISTKHLHSIYFSLHCYLKPILLTHWSMYNCDNEKIEKDMLITRTYDP
jgi:hypothetical protein